MLRGKAAAVATRHYMNGVSARAALRLMKGKGIKVSYTALLKHYKAKGKVLTACVKSPEKRKKRSYHLGDYREEVKDEMDLIWNREPSMSARLLRDHINATVLDGTGSVLTPSVQRVLKSELGTKTRSMRHGNFVSEANKPNRVAFAKLLQGSHESMETFIFSDESNLQVDGNVRLVNTKRADDPCRIAPKKKFPEKLMVWAALSWRGPGPIHFFAPGERLNSDGYMAMIKEEFLPWLDAVYGREHAVFIQDGASCHTANRVMKMFDDEGVEVMYWPPQSPELNAIEFAWKAMKEYVYGIKKARTVKEMRDAAAEWWQDHLTLEMCRAYITHAKSNLQRVIDAEGGPFVDGANTRPKPV